MDLPSLTNWLSPGALFAMTTGIVGGAFSIFGLPAAVSRSVRWLLLGCLALLSIAAAYNAALQDRDSAILMGAARDQPAKFRRIEEKLERLASGAGLSHNKEDLEKRVDHALDKAAETKSSRIDRDLKALLLAKVSTRANGSTKIRADKIAAERAGLLKQLTQFYILSNDGITTEVMAGMETPPVRWLNDQLVKRKANWRVVSCKNGTCQTAAAQ